MAVILRSIKTVFKARPLMANCVIYGALYTAAEFGQQTILRKIKPEKPQPYDYALMGRYTIMGSTFIPSFLYVWLKWLDKKLVGTAVKTVISKALIDQAVSSPINLAVFFIGMSLLEGREDIFAECKQKFVPSYVKSCMFWLPAQAVNFALVPSSLRVVYIGTCSLLWVNLLCIFKREPMPEDIEEPQKQIEEKKEE